MDHTNPLSFAFVKAQKERKVRGSNFWVVDDRFFFWFPNFAKDRRDLTVAVISLFTCSMAVIIIFRHTGKDSDKHVIIVMCKQLKIEHRKWNVF